MRLLYWTQYYWPQIGGVEVISARLLAALRARGYTPCVVTGPGNLELPDEDEHEGVPIYRFPFARAMATRDPGLLLETQRRLAALKRAFRPDVVHVNVCDPSVLFHFRTAAAHPAPLVATFHVPVPADASGAHTLLGTLLRSADWVTAVSDAQLATLRRLVPELTAVSSVIWNGGEAPALQPRPLPAAPPRLLYVGRLVPEKGVDVAIAAFASIAERFRDARLVVAGDGPARPALEQQARQLGVAHRTDFLGWVAPGEVPALMDAAAVVVMPSRWQEPFGLVALEAAQMARPVVGTRVGGLPEVVADGETGVLVEADDAPALARAVAGLLADPARAAAMGRAARERALAVFDLERYVTAYDQLYRQLIREAPMPARDRLRRSPGEGAAVRVTATRSG